MNFTESRLNIVISCSGVPISVKVGHASRLLVCALLSEVPVLFLFPHVTAVACELVKNQLQYEMHGLDIKTCFEEKFGLRL